MRLFKYLLFLLIKLSFVSNFFDVRTNNERAGLFYSSSSLLLRLIGFELELLKLKSCFGNGSPHLASLTVAKMMTKLG